MARDLQVEPADTELPDLTPQQYEFVHGLMKGMSNIDAHKSAYPGDWSDNSRWVEASRLRRHPKIRLWLNMARREQLTAARYTLDEHIKELDDLGDEARTAGAYGAATQCVIRKGMAVGHYIDRTLDLTPARNSDQQVIATLQRIFGEDAAKDAAKRLGYITGEVEP